MLKQVALALLGAVLSLNAETVAVRSGNGSVGARDSAVTFLVGPATGDFPNPLGPADFVNAQHGTPAFIVNRNPSWIPALAEDASAKWIGPSANAASSGATALYATSFTISAPFEGANITIHYASDDTPSFSGGVFLNGTVICQNQIAVGFNSEHTLSCDAGQLLQVGVNWLYFDIVNEEGGAGLLFSATVTTIGATPTINAGGIVNNAASTAPVAPGSIASVYGTFPVNGPQQAVTTPWPVTLSGLSMQFNGISAPLIYASQFLVNAQVPWELAGQTQAAANVTVGNQTSSAQTTQIATFAPGIFTMNAQDQGAILDSEYRLVDSSHPAIAGTSFIQIYCTGLGPVTNQPATGAAAPTNPLAQTTTMPVVTIGGVQAFVSFSGLTPTSVGLYQVNAQVPSSVVIGNAVPVTLKIGDATSNTVTIAVQASQSPNPPLSLAGSWTGAWGSILVPTAYGSLSASLTQNSSSTISVQGLPAYSVAGTINLNSSPCFGVGSVSGYVAGNAFALTATFAGQQVVILDGYLNANSTQVSSGAYTVQSGACTGDTGIFTADKN